MRAEILFRINCQAFVYIQNLMILHTVYSDLWLNVAKQCKVTLGAMASTVSLGYPANGNFKLLRVGRQLMPNQAVQASGSQLL